MAFRESCHRLEGHSTGVPHSLHAAGMRPFSDHHLARGARQLLVPEDVRATGLVTGVRKPTPRRVALKEQLHPTAHRPSRAPGSFPPGRSAVQAAPNLGSTSPRHEVSSARSPLEEPTNAGAEMTCRVPRGAARAQLVALETPETPLPARSPGALSAPASRPAGPRVPRGSRSRAAAWCRRRGGYGARCLTRPLPPLRARGSRARRPAAFGPAWEP